MSFKNWAILIAALTFVTNASASVNNSAQGAVDSFFEVLNSNDLDSDDLRDLLQGQTLAVYFIDDETPDNSRIARLRGLVSQISNPRVVRGYGRNRRLRNECPGAHSGSGRQGVFNCAGGYTGNLEDVLIYGNYQGQERLVANGKIECRSYFGREPLFTSHPGNHYCYIWDFNPVIPMPN